MATISIPIADANIAEVRDALCDYGGRTAQVPDPAPTAKPGDTIPNPVTKAEFATNVLKGIARDILKAYRQQQASKAAAVPPAVADL